jgi:hypothetical protein
MKSLPKASFMPTLIGKIRGIGWVWKAPFYDIYTGFVGLNINVTHPQHEPMVILTLYLFIKALSPSTPEPPPAL